MTDAFLETLENWQNYYFMIGGATAGLIGLMFVALSLGLPLIQNVPKEEGRAFAAPSVIYFVTVLLIAGVMLIPAVDPVILGLLVLMTTLVGCFNMFRRWRKLFDNAIRRSDFFLSDWMGHIIVPILSYVLLIAAAVCFIVVQWPLAFGALWMASILLMLAAITNTWA
ncbi:MAG: hypothetical protein H7175_11850, partial [Burkholderiales bacterium]|nr:hypothetical protein [Anaerolineae bacterium]